MKRPHFEAGRLDTPIEILQPTLAQDSAGGTQMLQQTSLFAKGWASVEALSGRELYAAQQLIANATHNITLHWRPGIIAQQNVRSLPDNRIFQVLYVDRGDGRQHVLTLLCVERNDGIVP
jgi:SPP1 family predicted phage head-tail adaptor